MLMAPKMTANIIRVSSAFAEATGMGLTVVSLRAAKDNTFLKRIQAGDDFRLATYDRVMVALSGMWREAGLDQIGEDGKVRLPWPADVPRPDPDALATQHRSA